MGTAFHAYTQDYDELFPAGCANTPLTGGWTYTRLHVVPPEWPPQQTHPRVAASYHIWSKTLQPYVKNYGIYACPSGGVVRSTLGGFDYGSPLVPWVNASYTFNGLLQFLPMAAVNTPGMLPMYWEGMGKAQVAGGITWNPLLNCPDAAQPCVYHANCAAGNGGTGNLFGLQGPTMWIHSGGATFLMADTHAKWRRLGATLSPGNTNANLDPYTGYDANGLPGYVWTNGCHPWLFRPDAEYDL